MHIASRLSVHITNLTLFLSSSSIFFQIQSDFVSDVIVSFLAPCRTRATLIRGVELKPIQVHDVVETLVQTNSKKHEQLAFPFIDRSIAEVITCEKSEKIDQTCLPDN
jgi:hypothetical protein